MQRSAAILNIWSGKGVFDRGAVIIWLESRGCTPRYRRKCIVGASRRRSSARRVMEKNLKGPNSHLRRSRVNRQEISCICCIGNFTAYKKKILYGFVDRRVLLKTRNLTWSTNIPDDIGNNLLTGLLYGTTYSSDIITGMYLNL